MSDRRPSSQNVGNHPRCSEDNRGFHRGESAYRNRGLQQQSQEPSKPESRIIGNQDIGEEEPQKGSYSPNWRHSGLSQVYGATGSGHNLINSRNFTARNNQHGRGRETGKDGWVQAGRGRGRARDGFVQQGRGRGRAREAWAESPEKTPAEYSHSESFRDDEGDHIFTGRGRARGINKRGGRLFSTQYCGHLATCDPRQGRSDQLEQIIEGRNQQIYEIGVQGPHEDQGHIRGDRHKGNQQKTEATGKYGNHVCLYCGDILSGEDIQESAAYHKKCFSIYLPWCQEAVAAFNGISRKKHVLYMAQPVCVVYGSKEQDRDKKKKKAFRDVKIKELLQKATALRNSDSGFLLIHLIGLDPEDNFTGFFDEFADVKLQGLINDGSLFDNVYKKRRLGDFDKSELKKFTNILVLYVEKGEILTTSDFKSKLALDDCIVDI